MFGILHIVIHIDTISILGPGDTAMGYRRRNGPPPPNHNGLPAMGWPPELQWGTAATVGPGGSRIEMQGLLFYMTY